MRTARILLAATAVLLGHAAPAGARPLIVGDSVTAAAGVQLRASGWDVDAKVNRTMMQGLQVLRDRQLPRTVAIALGTNASVHRRDITMALRIVGRCRQLVLITPRETHGETDHDARVIRAAGRRHPLRTRIVDWARHSIGHPSWLAGDLIHLTPTGAAAYTRLLAPIARDARTTR